MYAYCVYPAMSKSPKQLPNSLKKNKNKRRSYYVLMGVFNLRQHFEISYSRYANKHYFTGVYITINDSYR